MNIMVNKIPPFSFLKTIKLDNLKLEDLNEFRASLAGQHHTAENVGETGGNWLRSVLHPVVIDDIRKFARSSHKVLLLQGINLSTEIPSPRTGFLSEDQCVLDFDLLLFGMLRLLGVEPHAVEYENYGKLVRNVVPVPDAVGSTSSWGADVDFSWHTDNPNWPFADKNSDIKSCTPEYLAFTAVRNEEAASTDVVFIDTVLDTLPNWAIEQLMRPAFKFKAPASNESFHGKARIFPILEYSGCGFRMRFDESIITATDPDGKEALDVLIQKLHDIEGNRLVLGPGDFLIFKNTQVLHRRKAFEPKLDGNARWLRRIYGS